MNKCDPCHQKNDKEVLILISESIKKLEIEKN